MNREDLYAMRGPAGTQQTGEHRLYLIFMIFFSFSSCCLRLCLTVPRMARNLLCTEAALGLPVTSSKMSESQKHVPPHPVIYPLPFLRHSLIMYPWLAWITT